MAKTSKKDRRNEFVMCKMAERSREFFEDYMGKNAVAPTGLNDGQFEKLMSNVRRLAEVAYSRGVCDALDTEDGKELEKL